MITKSNELNFTNKKISMIIAGVPGIGKTTLALSAPKPLLVDLDKGVARVNIQHRNCDVETASNYSELITDLFNTDLTNYESIVIDTGGKLLEFLKPVVIEEDAKNKKRDGSLSLQGYGAVKRKFADFITRVKALDKNLIIVFHATEVALQDDLTGLRIRIEGSSRDEVWDDIDIGGFIEMSGNKRTIGFNNCPRYYAKGTYGINGIYEIPTLTAGKKNDFLTQLFKRINENLVKDTADFNQYLKVIEEGKNIINNVADVNDALKQIGTLKHILTSKEELWFALMERAKELGYEYNSTSKCFINNA